MILQVMPQLPMRVGIVWRTALEASRVGDAVSMLQGAE
jgi:hypothetical protein